MSGSVYNTGGEPCFKSKTTPPSGASSSAYGMEGPSASGIGGTENVVEMPPAAGKTTPSLSNVVESVGDQDSTHINR